ncbi:BCL2/adenovirus E1B 19 kDa protein-interacting protein 3-like [Argonauta hians]
MADNQFSSLDDDLTGSWVELSHQPLPADSDTISESIHNGNMEKLLMEAQLESSSTSQANSTVSSKRGSPRMSNSPKEWATSEVSQGESLGTDWIWDWSSRPELQPVGDLSGYFKHPSRHRLSVRNPKVLRNGVFCMENLPTLLISHACSFVLGAAVMFMYLKKYCNWAAVIAHHALD